MENYTFPVIFLDTSRFCNCQNRVPGQNWMGINHDKSCAQFTGESVPETQGEGAVGQGFRDNYISTQRTLSITVHTVFYSY